MDDKRFDIFTRALATGTSRRKVLLGLLGLSGAAIVGAEVDQPADAAKRPTPTLTPVRCPGNKTPVAGQCTCPPAAPNPCGPDCCTGKTTDSYPRSAGHSECCDNACCFGTCYGEELCCPTNRRAGELPPLASVCADGSCCLLPNVCYNGVCVAPSPTPTNTPTSTRTNTPTNTATSTSTNTPTSTSTNTATSTSTNTPANTATSTSTNTPANTPTNSPTPNGCAPNCDCSDPANDGLDCNGGLANGGGVCACGYCVVPLDGCPCGCAGDTECVQCAGNGVCQTYNQGLSCNGGAGICDGEWCVDAPPVDCEEACLYRCHEIDNGCDCGECPAGQFCMDSGWCCPGTSLGTDANCAYCGDVCADGTSCQGSVCTAIAP